jgi:hypothetical protein
VIKNKRYLVDFTATVRGTVMIRGKNKKDALTNLKKEEHVWQQIDEVIDQTRTSEFDYEFDARSIIRDEDAGTDPWTGSDEEE